MIENGIAVIGSTTIDKIISGDLSQFKIGGVTTYSGITYSRHGVRTLVVTNVAPDDLDIVKRLQANQIVVHNGQTTRTTHFIHNVNADNQEQKVPQRAASIGGSQVTQNLEDIRMVHLGPLHASDIDIEAIRSLDGFKRFVILDVQGYARSVRNKSVSACISEQLPAVLEISRIVKANHKEYAAVLDFFKTDLETVMNQYRISEFIVTSGDKGGFVQTITGERIRYDAAAINSIADPTGAGDIFLAAYVIGRLLRRHSIPAACKYAAKLAARQISGHYIQLADLGLDDRKEHQP
jgi:sugar/nucleoside kinase (ribokinase family)